MYLWVSVFFFFKQKTAYEMRISDWSSDVCSSDLLSGHVGARHPAGALDDTRVDEVADAAGALLRSEARRVGKECVIRVDLGGRRIIKKKNYVSRHRKSPHVQTKL